MQKEDAPKKMTYGVSSSVYGQPILFGYFSKI